MIADEASSSSPVGIPPPLDQEGGIPLHVNIGSQSTISSGITGDQVKSRKRRKPQNQALVAVRIRPLRSSEKSSGEQSCIRPILTIKHPACDQSSPGGKMKRILSPLTSNQSPSMIRRIRSPKTLLSPSRSSPSPRSTKKKKFGFDPKENSKEATAKSLICGTENKMRFDFDQVIGPSMTQELCFQRSVGDVVGRNVKRGSDTSIVALGHQKSGKAYTMTGGWKVSRKAGEYSHTVDGKLTESAGILPRAVHQLFEACQNLSGEYKSTVAMSFYMVACEGGRTRDLLMRFRDKSGEVREGITFVQVKSPEGVKRLMNRVTKKRASDIKEGRKFHIFNSFHVVLSYHDGVDRRKDDSISSTHTFVNLRTPANLKTDYPRKPDSDGYNLRDLLLGVSTSAQYSRILHRRLDDVLLGVASIIIVGCVSPLESEMEHSTDLLQLVAMATKATYFRENLICTGDSAGCSKSNFSEESKEVEETPPLSTCDSSSVLLSLQSTLRQADQAAKSARESSKSLEAVATKWRSHRQILTRESTISAIAQMKKIAGSKTDAETSSGRQTSSGKERGRNLGQKKGSTMKSEKKQDPVKNRRHGPRLIREKEEMKIQIGKLKNGSRLKDKRIKSLEENLASVNEKLAEEKQINRKLEDIRSILKRKAMLQDRRLQIVERKVAAGLKEGKKSKAEVSDIFVAPTDKRQKIENFEKVSVLTPLEKSCAVGENLLSALDDSIGESSVYLPGDDESSSGSIHITNDSSFAFGSSARKADLGLPLCEKPNSSHQETLASLPISNVNEIGQSSTCPCQESLLASEYAEKIEFYLPRLNISCLCGKQQELLPHWTDLGLVASILRPWQAEFLASRGIIKTEVFVKAHQKHENKLAKLLVNWRVAKRLETMPKQSCATALLIWSRSCSVAMRPRNRGTGGTKKPREVF